ncbi:MAG: hypothetical protein RIQ93_1538 [Verrucomicrobiota bacterium]
MQWEVLLATGLERTTFLRVQSSGGPVQEMRVGLEPVEGGLQGYIATIQPRSIPASAAPLADSPFAGYDLLAENSAAGFFDLNLASGEVRLTRAWHKLLGYLPAELPATLDGWHRLIHPHDSGASPDKLRKKVFGGTCPFSVEFRMKHQQGHWVWLQSLGIQIVNPAGEIDRVLGLHLDITERKELEEASLANDTRLQALSGGGPLAAFELDFANDLFWFSPAWERLLGYEDGELAPAAASFAVALPPEEAALGVQAWLTARSPGHANFSEIVRLRAKDGRPQAVLIAGHRTVTRKRDLARVVGFACALPAGTLPAADALPAALVEEAFQTLAEAVIITDTLGKTIFLNRTALRLLQVTAEESCGLPVGDVFRIANRQSNRPSDDPVERALSSDQPLPLISEDVLLPAIQGAPSRPIVWTALAAFGPEGRAQGVVLVFRDPEEMTLTPDELVKANRFESLGLLAGGIAHDFNNLLTTILGAVSLAKDNRDFSALNDAEKACMTAKGLTKHLLSFAKGGAGSQTVVATREILEDSIKIAAAASTAKIKLEIAADVQPILVDRAEILQVFQNLIVNALQAMPPAPHRPHLHVRATNTTLVENQAPSLSAGDYVEIEIRDNGSGIAPEHVAKIFDPFFTTKKHGTGLGLATVLAVLRKHGGQIGLDTQVGVGTAFTVYLPKAQQPIEVQARRAASLRFGTGRVLFMDDDPQISALTAMMLDSLEYKYDLAITGEEAIALYKRYQNIGRPYDAVIMDLTVVGGMGGDECFIELKKLDPEVRAIVASGYDNDEMARQFLAKGFCGYLTKPYRVTDLGKLLKTVLG